MEVIACRSVFSGAGYWGGWGRVVEALRAGLLQTPAPTQLRLMTALLLALQQAPYTGENRRPETVACLYCDYLKFDFLLYISLSVLFINNTF